jgi:hypothetical protein
MDHASTIRLMFQTNNVASIILILEQMLDDMVRTFYLLSLEDRCERQRLIDATVCGELWTVKETVEGVMREITDGDFAKPTDRFHAWTASLYKFGLAFRHLSTYEYGKNDPFYSLSNNKFGDILLYLQNYHGEPSHGIHSVADISGYFPAVYDMVSEVLAWNVKCLENLDDGAQLQWEMMYLVNNEDIPQIPLGDFTVG